jgi:hypothetical protein
MTQFVFKRVIFQQTKDLKHWMSEIMDCFNILEVLRV